MCKEIKRNIRLGKNSRPLPHLSARLLALHSQVRSMITCRHIARRSGPYHDQSTRAILVTAFKGTRKTSFQGVFRLQAFSGYGTSNTASWTPSHWPYRGEHPIRGYRSWFCRTHQVPYKSQNRRKGLSCIVHMQSYKRQITFFNLTRFFPKEPELFRAVNTARSSVDWTIFERVNGNWKRGDAN